MSSSGAVTLGEIAGRLLCWRLPVLIASGAADWLPDLRVNLAGDCPRTGAVSIHERRGVHYP
jgi:hypothetical protein